VTRICNKIKLIAVLAAFCCFWACERVATLRVASCELRQDSVLCLCVCFYAPHTKHRVALSMSFSVFCGWWIAAFQIADARCACVVRAQCRVSSVLWTYGIYRASHCRYQIHRTIACQPRSRYLYLSPAHSPLNAQFATCGFHVCLCLSARLPPASSCRYVYRSAGTLPPAISRHTAAKMGH
jgi:hypothetical protein